MTLPATRPPDIQRYFPPAGSPLEPYLLSIWRVTAFPAFSRETILPKGNLDLLFNLGPRVARIRDDKLDDPLAGGTAFLVGLQTSAFTTHPVDGICMLGMSLRIATCAVVLPLPPGEVTDLAAPGDARLPGPVRLAASLALRAGRS